MLVMVGWACAVLVSVTGQTIIHLNPLYTNYSDGFFSLLKIGMVKSTFLGHIGPSQIKMCCIVDKINVQRNTLQANVSS